MTDFVPAPPLPPDDAGALELAAADDVAAELLAAELVLLFELPLLPHPATTAAAAATVTPVASHR